MKVWFVHFPGNSYAYEFYGSTRNDAKQAARDWLRVKRLPNGTSVWAKDPDHDQRLLEQDPDLFRWR